jgi:hypothetical protein
MAAAEPIGRHEEPLILYGDSSPFPYGFDFLESVRAVIDCCVAMLTSQSTIDQMVKRSSEVERRLQGDRGRFDALLLEVQKAAGKFSVDTPRLTEAAAQVVATTRALVDHEREHSERQWNAEIAGATRIVDEACATALQALEALLLRHVPPQTTVGWRLTADDDGYDGTISLTTRFGLEASFGIAIPEQHAFAKPRRVGDIAAATAARLPRAGGARLVGLDRLFVSEAVLEAERIGLLLRARPRTGGGWRFDVHSESGETYVEALDEMGQPSGNIRELDEEEREPILRLSSAVLDATFDLVLRRQLLVEAKLDGEALRGRYQPRDVCTRLVTVYAPIVAEICRRSGSPNELMLRRDLGNGRRDSLFVTRAELRAKMARLPAASRRILDPFGL